MAKSTAPKKISFFNILTLDFWRYLGKTIYLFFPAIIFLIFAYFAFWNLGSAKDLMVMSLEKNYVFGYCLIALLFWTYVTWYTSRLVAKARQFKKPDNNFIWKIFLMQVPRLLGFTCFTITILAYLQLPYTLRISTNLAGILFVLSFIIYFLIYFIGDRLTNRHANDNYGKIKFLRKVRMIIYTSLLLITVVAILLQKFFGLIIMFICWQAAIVLLLIIRRKMIEAKDHSFFKKGQEQKNSATTSVIKQIRILVFDKEDYAYFRAFTAIALVAVTIYFFTIFSISFSLKVGAFPFVLLAFGVLLGYLNAIAFLSVLARFNFHVLFITLAVIIGSFVEPHYAKLISKNHPEILYKKRQHLDEYFQNWLNDSARNKLLSGDSVKEYPVYFVLANGGGARSAYWVASVLSKIEDETGGDFSTHLFCLSGASGGTWGNAVFFDLLRNKNKLFRDSAGNTFQNTAKSYLRGDFLTYTLARMLGPDIFRHIFPLTKAYDRDAALANAMEEVPGKKSLMYNSLSVGFSSFITQKNQKNYSLPVLCINTTRMQDGKPGVVSNIDVSDPYFNHRLDVLNMIDEQRDLKLSTAIVLGGSSPYINSAQRIDEKVIDEKTKITEINPQYFVDGGYFDNSGAGVVNEMIIELFREMNTDTSLIRYKNKIKFYVLHIANDPVDDDKVYSVSPLVNDLTSPVKTLMGSYGTQTSVNDSRLKNYMEYVYHNDDHYQQIDLYKKDDPMSYPVNWVISGHVVDSIDKRVATYEKIPALIQKMKNSF